MSERASWGSPVGSACASASILIERISKPTTTAPKANTPAATQDATVWSCIAASAATCGLRGLPSPNELTALAKIELSNAVPIEPPTCCIVFTIASALSVMTGTSSGRDPVFARKVLVASTDDQHAVEFIVRGWTATWTSRNRLARPQGERAVDWVLPETP